MDLLLLLAQVLVGDLVSKFKLALLLSEMRVDRKDGLVYDRICLPGPAIPGRLKKYESVLVHIDGHTRKNRYGPDCTL